MRKLIVDKMGLEKYQSLEEAMAFYPLGFKGLVTDYLTHYLADPSGALTETERDLAFYHHVLDLHDVHLAPTRGNYVSDLAHVTMLFTLVGVGNMVRDIVQEYGATLHNGIFDANQVDWHGDYFLVPLRA